MPINLGTINAFYGVNLRPSEVESFLASKRGDIANPGNLEEKAISLIGRDLYEAFIRGYTKKQWGCDPSCCPPASSLAYRCAPLTMTRTSTIFTRNSRRWLHADLRAHVGRDSG